jgi:hypothetical protein
MLGIYHEKQMHSTLPWYQSAFVNSHQMSRVIATLRNGLAAVYIIKVAFSSSKLLGQNLIFWKSTLPHA